MVDYTELLECDDFELRLVKAYKKDPIKYSLFSIIGMKKYCEEVLNDCETGMVLGENWHGGMTKEEWKLRKQYIEKVLSELNTI